MIKPKVLFLEIVVLLNDKPRYSITFSMLASLTLVSPFSILIRVGFDSESALDTSTNVSFIPVLLAVIDLANCSGEKLLARSGISVLLTTLPNVCLIVIQPHKLT